MTGDVGKPYALYIVLLDAERNIGGIEFGIHYDPTVKVLDWYSCAGTENKTESPDGGVWPASGSGNMLVFGNEVERIPSAGHNRESVVLGMMYVYAYGQGTFGFQQYPRHTGPDDFRGSNIAVSLSNRATQWITYPDNYGRISFGSEMEARDPCRNAVQSESDPALSITQGLSLSPGMPTPFRSTVRWRLTSTVERTVDGTIFAVDGKVVKTMNTRLIPRGVTEVSWDGSSDDGERVANGVYYLVVNGDDGYRSVQQAVLVR